MTFRRHLAVLTLLLLIIAFASLSADIETQTREQIREITNNLRENFRQEGHFLNLANSRTRDYSITERIYQLVDFQSDQWMNQEKEDFIYDDQGRLEVMETSIWNYHTEEWDLTPVTYILTWDNNDLLQELVIRYEEGAISFDIAVMTKTYNDNHQLIEISSEVLDDDSQEMVLAITMELHYDANNMIDYAVFTDHEYDEYEIAYITLDNNNRMSEVINEFSEDGENFYPEYREIYEYQPDDQSGYAEVQIFINMLAFELTFRQPTWIARPLFDAQYGYYWDDGWEPDSRFFFTYYPDQQIESFIREYYHDHLDDPWDKWERILYYYDDQAQLEEILCQYHYSEDIGWEDEKRMLITVEDVSDVHDIYVDAVTTRMNNYPNPFNPETTISFDLPVSQNVELTVLNIKGQLVTTLINEFKPAGVHNMVWDGRDNRGNELSSGVYFYRLKGDNTSQTGKMLLLK